MTSWNPEEESAGKVQNKVLEIEDRMIYGRNYYRWAEAPKYRRVHQFPTQYRDYPQFRNELSLYQRPQVRPELTRHDKNQYYFRHVEPPTYYEMWGY